MYEKLLDNIISDMEVELAELFDHNFEQKGFFGKKWEPRKERPKAKGTLLHVTGKMRRSIHRRRQGNGVSFTSALAYTELHNTGGTFDQPVRAHTRRGSKGGAKYPVRAHMRSMTMPQRQFIGNAPEVEQAIRDVIHDNFTAWFNNLANTIKHQ